MPPRPLAAAFAMAWILSAALLVMGVTLCTTVADGTPVPMKSIAILLIGVFGFVGTTVVFGIYTKLKGHGRHRRL